MSEHAERFIQHLRVLHDQNSGAMATLRHSLAFEPGTYCKAFPHVERFAGHERHARDAWRLALYAVAGLFARHPIHEARTFAAAFGRLFRERESKSIEQRFIAMLEADPENVLDYLRQAITLLAAAKVGLDYRQLLDDLATWMNPGAERDHLRQRWARDFYRAAEFPAEADIAS